MNPVINAPEQLGQWLYSALLPLSGTDEVSVVVVSDERKVDKVDDHHRQHGPENGAHEGDQYQRSGHVDRPQPPSMLQKGLVTLHANLP